MNCIQEGFDVFWTECVKCLQENIELAVDECRHSLVNHLWSRRIPFINKGLRTAVVATTEDDGF